MYKKTIDNIDYEVYGDDDEQRLKNSFFILKGDYVSTDFGFYPTINNKIIVIYDWYNTIQSEEDNNIYIIVGGDDVIIFNNVTNNLQITSYR